MLVAGAIVGETLRGVKPIPLDTEGRCWLPGVEGAEPPQRTSRKYLDALRLGVVCFFSLGRRGVPMTRPREGIFSFES